MSAAFRRPWTSILSVVTNSFGRCEGRSTVLKNTRELLRLRFPRNHFGAEINFYESFFLNFPGHPCSAAWNYL